MPLSAHELDDLYTVVMERLEMDLLPALTMANRTGDLDRLLGLLGMSDLLDDGGSPEFVPVRIMVVGTSNIDKGRLRSLVRKKRLNPDDFDFVLGHDELKHSNFSRKLRNSFLYRAVMVGPMPHSTPGKGDSSSFLAEAMAHPEAYPPVIRLQDSTGLKITNNSFSRALDELIAMG